MQSEKAPSEPNLESISPVANAATDCELLACPNGTETAIVECELFCPIKCQ